MRLIEADQMRAFAGGNAELRLPDGSTVFVAENTRFVVTKLDFGPQNERRAAIFHLAAGKLRGIIAHAAVALVQARQSIFSFTTPTAVAAVRGTTVYAVFDPTTNETTILVTDGVAFIWDFCTGQLVEVRAGEITRVQGREPSSSAPDVRPGSDVVASQTAKRPS
jgi:hypothetical protein